MPNDLDARQKEQWCRAREVYNITTTFVQGDSYDGLAVAMYLSTNTLHVHCAEHVPERGFHSLDIARLLHIVDPRQVFAAESESHAIVLTSLPNEQL